MRINILAFALGVCLLQQQAQLPAWPVLALPGIAAGVLFFGGKWLEMAASRAFPAIACILAGFAWAAAYGHLLLADRQVFTRAGVSHLMRTAGSTKTLRKWTVNFYFCVR